jgi:hypothetical protein
MIGKRRNCDDETALAEAKPAALISILATIFQQLVDGERPAIDSDRPA